MKYLPSPLLVCALVFGIWGSACAQSSDPFARPSSTVADNFSRANGSLGANWTTSTCVSSTPTSPTITNNQVVGNTPNAFQLAYYAGASFSSSQFSQVTVPVSFPQNPPDPNGAVELLANAVGNSCYFAQFYDGYFRIEWYKGGQRFPGNSISGNVSAGDVLRFESVQISGAAVLSLYQNGTLIEAVVDSSGPLTSGSPGLGVYGQDSVSVVRNFIGGNLPDGDLGTNWSVLIGSFGINNGVVAPTVSTNYLAATPVILNTAIWSHDLFEKDQYSQAMVANVLAPNDRAGVAVRVAGLSVYGNSQAQATGYIGFAYADGGGLQQWRINRLASGGSTTLASGSTTWSANDIIKLSVSGSTLSLYQNGNLLGTAQDNLYAAGNPGIFCVGGGGVKNWSGANMPHGNPPQTDPVESLSTLTSSPIASDSFQRPVGSLGSNWKNFSGYGGKSQIVVAGTPGWVGDAYSGEEPPLPGDPADDAPIWTANSFPFDQWSQMTVGGSPALPSTYRMGIGVVFRQIDAQNGSSAGYTYGDSLSATSYVYNAPPQSAQPTPRFIGWYAGVGSFVTLTQKGGPAFQPGDVVLGIAVGDVIYGYANGILDLQIRDTTSRPGLNDFNSWNLNGADHRMTSWKGGSVP